MRWRRAETLLVVDGDGREHELAEHDAAVGSRIPSQRRFLVSPDGRRLVFAATGGDGLVVRAADGSSRRIDFPGLMDFRFVSSAKLAASSADRQAWIGLDGGRVTPVAEVPRVRWMEPCRDGMALLHQDGPISRVTVARADGTTTAVGEASSITRLMASRNADRVAYTESHRLVIADLGGARRAFDLSDGHAWIQNGEMSADGSRVALVNDQVLAVSDDGRAPRPLWVARGINAVWLAGDELVAASSRKVFFARGRSHVTMPGRGRVRTVRFARRGEGVVVARDREVVHWTPGAAPKRLAQVESPDDVLGAQRWAGGLVIWKGRRIPDLGESAPVDPGRS